jgi:hypothetical protein
MTIFSGKTEYTKEQLQSILNENNFDLTLYDLQDVASVHNHKAGDLLTAILNKTLKIV